MKQGFEGSVPVNKNGPHGFPGWFFVFEGIDGCGKGTQIEHFRAWFDAVLASKLLVTKSPGGSDLGSKIREIMFVDPGLKNIDPVATDLLFMSNHVHNVATQIIPALRAGMIVVADRHWPSAVAYGQERGSREDVMQLYRNLCGVQYDRMILLTGSPAVFRERAAARKTETHQTAKPWDDVDRLTRIQANFIREFGCHPTTSIVCAAEDESSKDVFLRRVLPTVLGTMGLLNKEGA